MFSLRLLTFVRLGEKALSLVTEANFRAKSKVNPVHVCRCVCVYVYTNMASVNVLSVRKQASVREDFPEELCLKGRKVF